MIDVASSFLFFFFLAFIFEAAKGTFVKQNGLLGWAMYEAGGDYNNILSTAIAKAISG